MAAMVIVGLLVLLDLLQHVLTGALRVLVTLALFVAGGALLAVRWKSVGDRVGQELQAGYTTLPLAFGGFGLTHDRRPVSGSSERRRTPWDYSGTWVLDSRTGRPKKAPDRGVDPPGFYPSPTRPGSWELWTGTAWAGKFRRTPP